MKIKLNITIHTIMILCIILLSIFGFIACPRLPMITHLLKGLGVWNETNWNECDYAYNHEEKSNGGYYED